MNFYLAGASGPTRGLPVLKTGDNAYWDTFAGVVPCKVLSIQGADGMCSTNQRVKIKLTAGRGPYVSGEEHEDFGHSVLPKQCLLHRQYSSVIGPYAVQADQPKESNT